MHIRVARAFLPLPLLLPASVLVAQKQPFDVHTLMQLARIGDPQLSPDGRSVAFTVQTVDVEKNTKPKQIYVVPLDGGEPRKIAEDAERPRWSPDSRRSRSSPIAAASRRSGSWTPTAPTRSSHESFDRAPAACSIRPTARIWCSPATSIPNAAPTTPATSRSWTRRRTTKSKRGPPHACSTAIGRHGRAARRSHLLVIPVAGGAAKDLTPGTRDVPPFSLGGPDDYAISPDGTEVCYAMNLGRDAGHQHEFRSLRGSHHRRAVEENHHQSGADNSPQYSPDGKYLAYRAQLRAGYESDRWRLMLLERATGKLTNLTETLDRWVESFTWSPDSSRAVLHGAGSRPAVHPVHPGDRRRGAHRAQRRQPPGRHAVHARRQDHDLHAAERVQPGRRFSARPRAAAPRPRSRI